MTSTYLTTIKIQNQYFSLQDIENHFQVQFKQFITRNAKYNYYKNMYLYSYYSLLRCFLNLNVTVSKTPGVKLELRAVVKYFH